MPWSFRALNWRILVHIPWKSVCEFRWDREREMKWQGKKKGWKDSLEFKITPTDTPHAHLKTCEEPYLPIESSSMAGMVFYSVVSPLPHCPPQTFHLERSQEPRSHYIYEQDYTQHAFLRFSFMAPLTNSHCTGPLPGMAGSFSDWLEGRLQNIFRWLWYTKAVLAVVPY